MWTDDPLSEIIPQDGTVSVTFLTEVLSLHTYYSVKKKHSVTHELAVQ